MYGFTCVQERERAAEAELRAVRGGSFITTGRQGESGISQRFSFSLHVELDSQTVEREQSTDTLD